ncbi:MAG: endonuclease domain-containing protein [Deltaproteobacteria bacterium]|nr:endonuclease domain-containing protein [Deltaproteobacteria bacterium]
MLPYKPNLKLHSRNLRKNMTDSELILWQRLRRKQILNIQFYCQKPIGDYIVDFYAPMAKLVVEIDGSQHKDEENVEKDRIRDETLADMGLSVLRFHSNEVLRETDAVVEVIYRTVKRKINIKSP